MLLEATITTTLCLVSRVPRNGYSQSMVVRPHTMSVDFGLSAVKLNANMSVLHDDDVNEEVRVWMSINFVLFSENSCDGTQGTVCERVHTLPQTTYGTSFVPWEWEVTDVCMVNRTHYAVSDLFSC